jgi:signal peptidase II
LRKLLAPFIALIVVVVADQATKSWAINYLSEKPTAEVLGSFFMLTLVYNEGGAMGSNFGSPAYYLVSSILILLFLFYYIYAHRDNPSLTVPLALIAGGAVGNIIDRIQLGRVVDFIDIDFFDINLFGYQLDRWWTFNIADAMISCSITYLLIKILFFHRKTEVTQKQ